MSRLKLAVRWSNGMVMAFDEDGHQLQDLQGPYSEALREAVLARADPETRFEHGIWRGCAQDVSRDEWGGQLRTYRIIEKDGVPGIYCMWCNRVSFHPEDIQKRFCGGCKVFHDDFAAGPGVPRFRHLCSDCVFLGRYLEHDLYFCTQRAPGMPTVIARWSDEPPAYVSGLALADQIPALGAARLRACNLGLLPATSDG
jgi:hypothetical protein